MDWASSAAVVPSASSRVEPSGRPTEMTPGIVHPFLLSRRIAPGPDTVRGAPRVLDRPCGPDPSFGQSAMPSRRAPVGDRTPGRGLLVEGAQRGRRVEVVVERGPHRRQPRRAVAAPVAVGRAPPQRQPGRRRGHVLVGAPVPVLAVVVAEEGEPDGGRVPLLAQVAHEDEVAERLRHLRAVQPDQADVEPEPHEGLARHRLGLGRLALVVREHEVPPPAVDVDRLAQLAQHEGRALDVPPRPARPPARLPRRLVGERRLPQHEVERVALVRVVRAGPRAPPPARASGPGRSR